jgi:hypothetical protein
MSYDTKYIFSNFRVSGTFKTGEPYGSGHINDTFRVLTSETDKPDYILQRINHHIFKNVPKLQDNILRVTSHIRKKLEQTPGANPDRETLTLIPALDGKPYFKDQEGNFWRIYIFIDKNRSYDRVESPAQAYEGGKAFGRFQYLISDLEGDPLHETIPNFHNMDMRLKTFFETVKNDPANRVSQAGPEIKFVEERAEVMTRILRLGEEKKIPERITHNDTKFNNVLLDENDKRLCVIDLDTVMPGYIHYDFGDSIRTTTNTGNEDEKDLSKVEMDIRLFEAYSKGFLEETKSFLTPVEIDNLAFSGKMMTFIIGLRFITDYLDGDHYFKIHHEHHNLQRAKAQFKLVASMERQFEDMQKIIEEL